MMRPAQSPDATPWRIPRQRGRRLPPLAPVLALLLALASLAGVGLPSSAHAQTITVACDGDLTAAIFAAASGDTISLDGGCTYELFEELPRIIKTLIVEGNGATITRSSAAGPFRIFTVQRSVSLTLNHVTLSNGSANYGGGILNDGGTVTLIDSTVSGNQATNTIGGGIYNNSYSTSPATLTLINSTVSGNRAASLGGGIYSTGAAAQVTIQDGSTITENRGSYGGGIYSSSGGTLTVTDSTVSSNQADFYGGGIYNEGGTLTLTDSAVSDNQSVYHGGGIHNSAGTVTLTNTALSGNQTASWFGGGIYSSGAAAQVTIQDGSTLSGNNAFDGGGLYVAQGTATLSDSTLDSNTVANTGGGLYIGANGQVTVLRVTISNNRAPGSAGGIINGGTLTLTESNLTSNTAGLNGGGIRNTGTLTVTASTLAMNTAGQSGGGIHALGGTLTLRDSTLEANAAPNGGGIYAAIAISGATVAVERSTLRDNRATGAGGGIYTSQSTLSLTDSTLAGNMAGFGGGIYTTSTPVTIIGSTFSGNQATGTGGGGAIYSNSGKVDLANSTVAGNSARQGGGVYQGSGALTLTNSTVSANSATSTGGAGGIYGNVAEVTLRNTIVAAQAVGADCAIVAGYSITDGGHNLASDGSCNLSPANGSLSNTDPKLGPLADNGGLTQTMLPGSNSPAINAGDDAVCAASPVDGLDQRGVARPQGTRCDIGAVETEQQPQQAQTITVDPVADQTYGAGPITVSASGGGSGNPVTFASTTPAACTTSGSDGATISLVGAGTCTLTADQAGNDQYAAAPQVSVSFTVNRAPLTIAADDQTITAGDPLPTLRWTAAGWVNGEGADVLTEEPACSTTAQTDSPAGTYPITCAGAEAANYSITYEPGTLTIVEPETLSLTMTPAASRLTVGDTAVLTVTVTSSRGTTVPDGTLVTVTISGMTNDTMTVSTTNGRARISYAALFPGSDSVTATLGEASAHATVSWQAPGSSLFATVLVLNPPRPFSLVTAGSLLGRPTGTVYYLGPELTFKSQKITSVVARKGAATIFGTATVDGQSVVFRVDVAGGLTSGTLRLRVSNGFDSGVVPVKLNLTL